MLPSRLSFQNMTNFKTIRTKSEAVKSKGDWQITSVSPKVHCNKGKIPRCNLLSLPGEIRNFIYSLVYDRPLIVEMVSPKISTVFWHDEFNKLPKGTVILRHPHRLGPYSAQDRHKTHWEYSYNALLCTCKQLYNETTPYLYRSTIFVFHSAHRLQNFLTNVRPCCLSYIGTLYFHHTTYGHPKFPSNESWKQLHQRKLRKTLKDAVLKLNNVNTLRLSLEVDEVPLKFSLDEEWAEPMLRLADLPLEDVRVLIHDVEAIPCELRRAFSDVRQAFRVLVEDYLLHRQVGPLQMYIPDYKDAHVDEREWIDYLIN